MTLLVDIAGPETAQRTITDTVSVFWCIDALTNNAVVNTCSPIENPTFERSREVMAKENQWHNCLPIQGTLFYRRNG